MLRLALHELRTPLTSVQLNAQLIERSLVKLGLEKEGRLAATIVSSARRLDALTQKLGDVARLRSGSATLDVGAHDLSRLLPEFLSRHAETLEVGRIRMSIPGGPLPIAADARRLDGILADLLSIALDRDEGRAGIDLRVTATAGEINFAVTVPGAASGDPPEAPSEDALGLGFLVARHLIECHGGKLDVRGESGGTLVLSFGLPRR